MIFTRLAAALALAALPVVSLAQGYPADPSGGTKLGIEMLNNSGQIGTVNLFRAGAGKTRAIVRIDGAPAGKVEAVKLYRGSACDDVAHTPSQALADLRGGQSASVIPMNADRLLSGNYNIVVFSGTYAGARSVACGHLFRS